MTCAMSTCRSAAATMRCSRCTSVVYCSRVCQRDHWPSHKRSCAHMHAAKRWKKLEVAWWRGVPHEYRVSLEKDGYDVDAMMTYGEVYFMLEGLKPSVLLSGVPVALREDFYNEVIKPCGLADDIHVATVDRVRTQAFDFNGKMVLLHRKHERYDAIVAMLQIHGHAEDVLLTEGQVAWMLDYPVAFDECNEGTMLEIAYFSVKTNDLLTSFCVMDTVEHRQRVNRHLQQYQAALGEMLPIQVQAVIVSG